MITTMNELDFFPTIFEAAKHTGMKVLCASKIDGGALIRERMVDPFDKKDVKDLVDSANQRRTNLYFHCGVNTCWETFDDNSARYSKRDLAGS